MENVNIKANFQTWCVIAMRVIVGWHLAYLGIWALLTSGGFSWFGQLHAAHWIFADTFKAISTSAAMPVIDIAIAVLLVAAGIALMFGRAVTIAAIVGGAFLALQYVTNPPHFGHTGMSHIMFIDRNLVEIAMLIFVAAAQRAGCSGVAVSESQGEDALATKSSASKGEDALATKDCATRRDLIVGIGSTVALAGAGVAGKVIRSEPVIRLTGPAVPPFDPSVDLAGLSHPMTAYGKIKDVNLSRIILGGNVIGGWAHGRDMHYYDKMVKAYHTDERVFRTFRMAEAAGVNTILTNPALMRVINRYWREDGGKIQFISDCGHRKGAIEGARVSVENGASLVYCHGFGSDAAADKGDWQYFRKYLDEARKLGVPAGIGCHSLEVVKLCVEHDCIPDFWMKTVHRIDYPTAHIGEVKGKKTKFGLGACDNRFVDTDRQTIFDFMAKRPEPWIAFKVLGAGIEHPKDAFPTTFMGGADFACVGMYDYQIVEDVNIANKIFENGLPKRNRPWCG